MTTADPPITVHLVATEEGLYEIEVILTDYKGRVFEGPFWVDKDPAHAPGWFIFGRCLDDYKPEGIIKRVGRPNVKARKHPHYNVAVRRGWQRKKAAQALADWLTHQQDQS